MKTSITLLLLWFLAIPLLAQNGYTGVIYPEHDNFKGCCMYVPETGFNLYDTPSGKIIGKIINGTPEYGAVYKLYLQRGRYPDELIPYDKMEMVGYEVFSLVFTKKQDSFVKVLGNYWISIDEIKKGGLEAINYRDFLIKRTNEVLGYYATPSGLNLRTGPSTEYDVIKTIQGDTMQITLTETCKGDWCKVKITEHKKHPCTGPESNETNIVREYEGWIKVLDKNGMPNVWHYAKGC